MEILCMNMENLQLRPTETCPRSVKTIVVKSTVNGIYWDHINLVNPLIFVLVPIQGLRFTSAYIMIFFFLVQWFEVRGSYFCWYWLTISCLNSFQNDYEQWWSTIPPISTNEKPPVTSNNWTQEKPWHMALEIQVLDWKRHKNVEG